MKKALAITILSLAALAAGLSAQDLTLESAMSSLGKTAAPAASAPVVTETAAAPASAAAERDWLFLVFINGVNDLGIMGFADNDINEMEQVGSTPKMAVVVEYSKLGMDDPFSGNLQMQRGSRTLYITKDAEPAKITSPLVGKPTNTTDMGSAAHLVRFVTRAVARFPAKKVAVVVWNHGAGQNGISFDDVSGKHMEVDELGRALADIKGVLGHNINLFATDACLMQMAAVAYELRNSADVVVGSEEVIPGNGYPYTPILSALASKPGMAADELGRLIVTAYGASYRTDATLSAVRAPALNGLRDGINSWVTAIKADPASMAAAADARLVENTSHFSDRESRDLVDYLQRVNAALPEGKRAKEVGAALIDFVQKRLVIHHVALPARDCEYTKAEGMAIYIPDLRYNSAKDSKFAFAQDSLWDDFLLDMLASRKK